MIRHDADQEISYTAPLLLPLPERVGQALPVLTAPTTRAYVELLNREGSLDGPVAVYGPKGHLDLLPAAVPLLVPALLVVLALSQLGWLGWSLRRRQRGARRAAV